ncbi:hypothetical protein BGZ94_008067, partial [Podila epigama]
DNDLEHLYHECSSSIRTLTTVAVPTQKDIKLAQQTSRLLLQQSIARENRAYTKATIRIMRALYDQYESIAREVCRGRVPFMDTTLAMDDHPLSARLSIMDLKSTLSCLYYLLISRYAQCWPSSQLWRSRERLLSHANLSMLRIHMVQIDPQPDDSASQPCPWISTDMDTKSDVLTAAELEELDEDIFGLVTTTLEDQLELGLGDIAVQLAHWHVLDNVLKLHRHSPRTVDRSLTILETMIRNSECLKVLSGWSTLEMRWTNDFVHLYNLASLVPTSQRTTPGTVVRSTFFQMHNGH